MASQDYKFNSFVVDIAPATQVAHVQISRPEKLNAFDRDTFLECGRLFERLGRDVDVRAIVLSGAGDRAFTAGLDVGYAAAGALTREGDVARVAGHLRRLIDEFQHAITAIEKCPKRTYPACPASAESSP